MKQKGKYEKSNIMQKKRLIWIPLLLVCLCFVVAGFWFLQPKEQADSLPLNGSIEVKPGSIAIPGYEGIHVKADSVKQTLGFPNPKGNPCYFQISLLLDDGTLLWQSELVAPGSVSNPIMLSKPLAAGVYANSTIRIDCYSYDAQQNRMNGAETKLTLFAD